MEDFIFDDDVDEVGAEVEAHCPKCKADTQHVVVSKYEDEIRRVQCNPCGDVHPYRKPRGESDEEEPAPAVKKKAVKAKPNSFKMGGTGTAQEDQLVTVQLEQALGLKLIYVPFKGGGEVCVNLVGKHVDSTVNNPIECAGHWKANRVRPLAVFDHERLAAKGWGDIPTIKEALGVDIEYLMLRGIFGAPKMPPDALAFYQEMLKKVSETPEFRDYLEQGALKAAWQTGPEFVKWLEGAEDAHRELMKKGGLLK